MSKPSYPRVAIRIWPTDGPPFVKLYIGLSAAVAEHPQAWRVELVDEAAWRAAGGSFY